MRRGQANSHAGKGWEQFTDRIITVLNGGNTAGVHPLGRNARAKGNDRYDKTPGLSPHIRVLSAYSGFFGSLLFSRANRFLQEVGLELSIINTGRRMVGACPTVNAFCGGMRR